MKCTPWLGRGLRQGAWTQGERGRRRNKQLKTCNGLGGAFYDHHTLKHIHKKPNPNPPPPPTYNSNLLKPALARGEVRCIGATTLSEYKQYIEKDKALERRFQKVQIGEPTAEDTVSILRGLKPRYEMHHGVRITDDALLAAAKLSDRYIQDRFLPDKAIDLVDEACAKLKNELTSKPQVLDEIDRRVVQLEMER
jgi:hypothetical protein